VYVVVVRDVRSLAAQSTYRSDVDPRRVQRNEEDGESPVLRGIEVRACQSSTYELSCASVVNIFSATLDEILGTLVAETTGDDFGVAQPRPSHCAIHQLHVEGKFPTSASTTRATDCSP
jgi:hypothetical protein